MKRCIELMKVFFLSRCSAIKTKAKNGEDDNQISNKLVLNKQTQNFMVQNKVPFGEFLIIKSYMLRINTDNISPKRIN